MRTTPSLPLLMTLSLGVFACENLPSSKAGHTCDPAAKDICNFIDDDCDGLVDEDVPPVKVWHDTDGDGFGDGVRGPFSVCVPGSTQVTNGDDCVDTNPDINPDAKDECNYIDDDCDRFIDEDEPPTPVWLDEDEDGFGDAAGTMFTVCVPGGKNVTNNDDCDDTDPDINPDAKDVCNHVDDDCDRFIDEDEPPTQVWYDADGDGYGDAAGTVYTVCVPGGTNVTNNDDCDDTDAAVNPMAKDVCNYVDDDCDRFIDEDEPPVKVWTDDDGDGYGDPWLPAFSVCVAGSGQVENDDDCDDDDAAVSPGAAETCNDVDDNCDGSIDEGGVCTVAWCGVIDADELWSTGDTISVSCDIDIIDGATLVIQDGVTVEFDNGAGITVGAAGYGAIDVQGYTSGVVFTSSASAPAADDWDGLTFGYLDSGSYIYGLTVEYGGDSSPCVELDAASISFEQLTVSNCGGAAAMTVSDGSLGIYYSSIENNDGVGIDVASDGSISYWYDVDITGNGDIPLRATAEALYAVSGDTYATTLSGNTVDEIELRDGQVTGTGWLADFGLPYILSGDLDVSNNYGGTGALFLDAGVELRVAAGAEISVGDGASGVLTAIGTSTDPVVITSDSASPAAGDWQGITIGSDDGGSLLEEIEVSYGGGNGLGNLVFDSSGSWAPSVTNATISHSAAWGIYRASTGTTSPTLTGITYSSNASGTVY